MSVSQSAARTLWEPIRGLVIVLVLCGSFAIGCGDPADPEVERSSAAETAILDRAALPEAPPFVPAVPAATSFASFSADRGITPLEYTSDERNADTGHAPNGWSDEILRRLPPIGDLVSASEALPARVEDITETGLAIARALHAKAVEAPTAIGDGLEAGPRAAGPVGTAVQEGTPNQARQQPAILIMGPDGKPLDGIMGEEPFDRPTQSVAGTLPPVEPPPSGPMILEYPLSPASTDVEAASDTAANVERGRYSLEPGNQRAEASLRPVPENRLSGSQGAAVSRLPEAPLPQPSLVEKEQTVSGERSIAGGNSTSLRDSTSGSGEPPPTVQVPAASVPSVAAARGGPVEPLHPIGGLLLHATQARHHVQQGFGAANRGMLYTAREEFLQALRVVAEAKDAHSGRRTHMDALAAGLTTLHEADDIRRVSNSVAKTDLSMWIATHTTPVLQGHDVSTMLPLAIIDRYHAYAQQKLGAAVAGDASGSMALYGLARIYEYLGSENGADRVARSRQSVALHEAAILAHPENHLAAHELGVVLTKLGRFERAVAMLTRSVQLSPTPTAYRNLAVASRRFGRHQQAAIAERYAAQMAEREGTAGGSSSRVTWLEPDAFSRTSERTAAVPSDAHRAPHDAARPQGPTSGKEQESDKASGWWKLPMWK